MMFLQGHDGPVRCLAFSPDGSTLASGDDQTAWLWDSSTGQVRAAGAERSGEITCLAFSPDGLTLATGDRNGGLQLREGTTARPRVRHGVVANLGTWHNHPITALSFVAGGRSMISVAASSSMQQVAIWSPETGHQVVLEGFEVVWGLGADAGGRTLFFGSGTRYLSTWRLGGIWFESWIDRDVGGPFGAIRYSHERIHHARMAEGKPRYFARSRPKSAARPRSLGVAPDGLTIAAPWGRVIELWDAVEFRLRATLSGHDDDVMALAFAPDGRTLVSSSIDGTVRLWDAVEGRPKAAYDWEIGPIHCVGFAPDGSKMAAGGDSGLVVWDVDEA